VTIRVLGAIEVLHEGEVKQVAPAGRNLLAILAAAGPDGLTDEQLAHEIWGDTPGPNWDQNIRRAISRMRRSLPHDAITSGGRRYALNLATDQIDAWQLLDHTNHDLASIAEDRLRSLLADAPYPEPSESKLVTAARTTIEAARAEVLGHLCGSTTDQATPSVLHAVAQAAKTSWNEQLIRASAEFLHAHGNDTAAAQLLDDSITRLEVDLDVTPSLLVELRATIRSGGSAAREPSDVVAAAPTWLGPRPTSATGRAIPRRALLDEATAALDRGHLVVTGEPGSGKTALISGLSRQRFGSGGHVIWIGAHHGDTSPYQAVLAVLPDSLAILAAEDEAPEPGDESRRLAEFARHLDTRLPDRPITIVVDDAQWLDSHSIRLVHFLARSNDPRRRLIVVGRPTPGPSNWSEIFDGLERLHAERITVDRFDLDELGALVGGIHPSSTSRQRSELARRLRSLRADLPLIADDVVASLDTESLTLTSIETSAPGWTDSVWTGTVSPKTQSVAAMAALAGITWTFSDVLALGGGDPTDLADAIDELIDAGLILTEARPDRYSFRHILIRDAFAATLTPSDRRALHLDAAATAASRDDVHRRARHLVEALPVSDPAEVAEGLLASAHAHLEQQSWLEATSAFAAADNFATLDTATLGRYAYAIERSGGVADVIRRRGFEAARAEGDAAAMLAVIVEGVDSGELLEANAARLDLLLEVPRDQLGQDDQRRLDLTLCRELGLAGRGKEARALHAERLARPRATDEEAAVNWLAVWTALMGTPVETWPGPPPAPESAPDPVDQARLHNIACEHALVIGDRPGFERHLDELNEAPATQAHPTRRWGLHLLQSLHAQCDGDFATARTIADAGLAIATEHGLAGGFPARAAQAFAEAWVTDTHGALLPLLEAAAPDVRDSLISTAARATALAATDGRRDEARELANQVLADLATTTQAVHPPIGALFAGAANVLDDTARERVAELLRPHEGTAILLGAGVAHLGPARRGLALLAHHNGDASESDRQMRLAIDEADRWRIPVWSVRCRVDLHRMTGDEAALAEAQALADGTDLVAILG
jgi:DNA-binding SARP family transcriptional activator